MVRLQAHGSWSMNLVALAYVLGQLAAFAG